MAWSLLECPASRPLPSYYGAARHLASYSDKLLDGTKQSGGDKAAVHACRPGTCSDTAWTVATCLHFIGHEHPFCHDHTVARLLTCSRDLAVRHGTQTSPLPSRPYLKQGRWTYISSPHGIGWWQVGCIDVGPQGPMSGDHDISCSLT